MAEEKCYKAFHPGMICNGKQYAENTDYEEAGADKCCQAGVMHYCKEPLAVLRYYDPVDEDGNIPEFAQVTPLAKELKAGDKYATKKLHIGAKISLGTLIKAQVDYDMQRTGDASLQAATGDASLQAATGNASLQAATGAWSLQAATGDRSRQAATGYASRQAATGDWSRQAATGDESRQKCEGERCISAIIGNGGRIKSKIGNWIVLAEWDTVDGKYTPVCVKAAQIDGEKLKPDVWYTLKGGEFVEVEE